jgi:hypothetical protein
MRIALGLAGLVLAACSPGISSIPQAGLPPGQATAGIPYHLPKGLVPLVVFAGKDGIGITIGSAENVADEGAGVLLARLQPSPFNKEHFKVAPNGDAGFLSTISTDSQTQVIAIAQEAAKSLARTLLQNAAREERAATVVLLEHQFDPLSAADVRRAEGAVNAAIRRGMAGIAGRARVPAIALSVTASDGGAAPEAAPLAVGDPRLDACRVGICARVMATRFVRIAVDGDILGTHPIRVPAVEPVAVEVPQSPLADQKISIALSGGIVTSYEIQRDSPLVTVGKIPSAVLGGFASGFTEQFAAEKSIAETAKEAADARAALAPKTGSIDLQTGTAPGGAKALTVYPYLHSLRRMIDGRAAAPQPRVGEGQAGDLVSRPGT